MPQVRDPKTGRYTSGGGSSVGGAAGTNPRIQKAKAVGGGATAGGTGKTVYNQKTLSTFEKGYKSTASASEQKIYSEESSRLQSIMSGRSAKSAKSMLQGEIDIAKKNLASAVDVATQQKWWAKKQAATFLYDSIKG
jgi:hypothetical protein